MLAQKQTIIENWPAILHEMKKEYQISDISYKVWLKPLTVHQVDDVRHLVTIITPQEEFRRHINDKYLLPLRVSIGEYTGTEYDVSLILSEEAEKMQKKDQQRKHHGENHLNADQTFDSFVVGKSNRFAFEAAKYVAEHPGKMYNPLFIYGASGLGKTHLLQAIGSYITSNHPGICAIYVTAEMFMNELIESIRRGRDNTAFMQSFREKYRKADVLLIDDIQFITGKETTQQEFFHTFNALFDAHCQIVLSSDRAPKDLTMLDERYRSRCAMGLLADIQRPEEELRLAILQRMNQGKMPGLSDEVLSLIARKVDQNNRLLIGAYHRIYSWMKLCGEVITPEVADNHIRQLITEAPEETTLTPENIITAVAEHYHVRREDILGKSRRRDVACARHVAAYLSKQLTDASLLKIGEQLGGRDHSTIKHSLEVVEDMLKDSAYQRGNMEMIKKKLGK